MPKTVAIASNVTLAKDGTPFVCTMRIRTNERPQSPISVNPTTESTTAATALNVTEVGQSGSTYMIVPVWVSTALSLSKE